MSSGGRRVEFNTRERAISDDHDQVQQFTAQAIAEILRYWIDCSNELDQRAGGEENLGTGSETILRAAVLNGLRVEPIVASQSIIISPGVALFIDNAAATFGDSIGSWVVDPGQQTLGVLTLTANGGGGTRIDVVECQTIDLVEVSDNRDIFSIATALFTPTLVDKIVQKRLTYRIRTGTSGAGFPGTASGWLPLAIASVPVGAANWDDCRIWDVRPLVSDRMRAPHKSPRLQPEMPRQFLFSDVFTMPGVENRLSGQVETEFNGGRAGGRIQQQGLTYIDVAHTDNLDAGIGSLAGATWYYLYSAFPFSLPRWVELQPASAGARLPTGLRGIPVVSDKGPNFDGRPNANITIPNSYAFAAPGKQDAVILCSSLVDTGFPIGPSCEGVVQRMSFGGVPALAANGGSTLVTNNWTLTDGTNFPRGAKAIWVKLRLVVSVSLATEFVVGGDVSISDKTGASSTLADLHLQPASQNINAGTATTYTFSTSTMRVSLQHDFATTTRVFLLQWTTNIVNANVSWSSASLFLQGWEFGP